MPQLYSNEYSLQESPCYGGSDELWSVSGRLFWNHSTSEDSTASTTECLPKDEHQGTTARGQYNVAQFNELKFPQLVKSWHTERGITSSILELVTCRSYLRIIGMGEAALPLIFAQLEREGDDPDHWFTALEAITGENPVSEESYGDTVSMAEDWLSWARITNVR